jgi:translation elongation factor Ts
MANITVAEINALRQRTGAGMMDCKKALIESDGDTDKAIEYLREKGQKLAVKRSERDASQGCVLAKTTADHTFGAIMMLNCETDFVAQNEGFISFTNKILDAAIGNKINTLDALNELVIEGSKVKDLVTDQIGKIGENIKISHYEVLEASVVYAYIHNGNRLASLVAFSKKGFDEQGKEIAMQIAAMAPVALNRESVPQNLIDEELEVYRVQIREEGKPENMVDKIAQGKLNKYFKECTLLEQEFIKDGKKTVKEYLQESDKDLTATAFYRFMLGE